MATLDDFYTKQLLNIKGVGPKRLANITIRLAESGQSFDIILNMTPEEIKKEFKLPIHVATAISSTSFQTKSDDSLSDLVEKDVKILRREQNGYPQRIESTLGSKSPEILYVWGNLKLLNRPAVGFCGSRNVTEKGLEVTADTARQIAEQGWVIVSGHARGVDTTAHRVAIESGGGTIIVAPQGILDFKLRAELRRIAKPEQLLIISEFAPTSRWHVGYAMKRNKTIIGLSDAMILVEARTEGGTFSAGQETLRLRKPLFVAQYRSPGTSAAGNEYFLKQGAIALGRNQETGHANISYLISIVSEVTSKQHWVKSIEADKQLTLL